MKLHLGCGPHVFQGWDNLDLLDHPGVIKHDLTQPLPYVDNSVDFAFSEHFLEHLTRKQGLAFLKEVRRVLKPGGVFRLVMPDLDYLLYQYHIHQLIKLPGVWEPSTRCQMLNEGMRSWGHKFLYNDTEIALLSHEACFFEISKQGYQVSPYEELRNLEIRPYNYELIVEIKK